MLGARSTDFYLNPLTFLKNKSTKILEYIPVLFFVYLQTISGISASCFQCVSPVNKEKLIKQLSHNQRTKT